MTYVLQAFTQGLAFHAGVMYESTGLKGQSSLRKLEYPIGKVLDITYLDSRYFGEGITVWNESIYMLTWQ